MFVVEINLGYCSRFDLQNRGYQVNRALFTFSVKSKFEIQNRRSIVWQSLCF